MTPTKLLRLSLPLLLGLLPIKTIAKEVIISTPSGESYILDVDPKESFLEIAYKIQDFAEINNPENDFIFEVQIEKNPDAFPIEKIGFHPQAHKNSPVAAREYFLPLDSHQRAAVHYIITTLANKSLASIFGQRGKLETAGASIRSVHPLRFLCHVYSDEELKVGIHNIRNRKIIWKDFAGGIRESFEDESRFGNIKEDHIEDFCKTVEIKKEQIQHTINTSDWDRLLFELVDIVPRKGDPKRYDS